MLCVSRSGTDGIFLVRSYVDALSLVAAFFFAFLHVLVVVFHYPRCPIELLQGIVDDNAQYSRLVLTCGYRSKFRENDLSGKQLKCRGN